MKFWVPSRPITSNENLDLILIIKSSFLIVFTVTILINLNIVETRHILSDPSDDVNPLDYLEPFEKCGRTPIFDSFASARGKSRSRQQVRITNGFAVERGEYPSYVGLYELSTNHQIYSPWCGGVLVGPRLVLTAAHCVEAEKKQFKVVLGLYNRAQTIEDVLEVPASSYCVHDLRNQPPQSNDLAVIYLSKPVKYRQTIQPACVHFNTPNMTLFATKQTDEFTLTGMGNLSKGRDSDRLYKAYFRYLYPRGSTEDDFPGANVFRSIERFTQACHGDSGSPMYYYRDASGRDRMTCRDDMQLRQFVSGLASRGTACDNDNFSIEYRANIERQEEDLLYIMKQIIVLNESDFYYNNHSSKVIPKNVPKNCYKFTNN